jgi:hypothetical protein
MDSDKQPCSEGFGRAADGNCYPIVDGHTEDSTDSEPTESEVSGDSSDSEPIESNVGDDSASFAQQALTKKTLLL